MMTTSVLHQNQNTQDIKNNYILVNMKCVQIFSVNTISGYK